MGKDTSTLTSCRCCLGFMTTERQEVQKGHFCCKHRTQFPLKATLQRLQA